MKHKKLIFALSVAFITGILLFAFTQEWLIFNLPFGRGRQTTQVATTTTTRKKIGIYIPRQGLLKREDREILWGDNTAINGTYLVATWLDMLEEEQMLNKKTLVQSVVAAHDGHELLLSFDRAPINKNGSTAEKLLFIESLLKSIRMTLPTTTAVRFLVDHKIMIDPNLDFSRPWPIAGFLGTQEPTDSPVLETIAGVFTLMIDPAGDAQKTGRVIGDSFERTSCFAFAHALKEELERTIPQLRVIITREPGEVSEQLQSATFSNRLHTNLFVSLACYQEQQDITTCSLYYLLYDPITDFWYKKITNTNWEPYFTAHCANLKLTLLAIKTLHDALSPYHQRGLFQLAAYKGIPCRPLAGIQAPAICCELGIHNPDGWRLFVGPFVEGISHVVESLRTKPVSFF